jgi:molybdopterin converting factor small subunit
MPSTGDPFVANVFIKLPVGIAGANGSSRLECRGTTVREALADCIDKEPRLRSRIFRADGSVWVGVFLNGRNIKQVGGLDVTLADGDELRILPPIAGG